ncbi:hypothetical protein KSP39_PZI019957 [Platanthera zijinensis]|uniref:T-complex protein 11 n=1 Tax=Platanthera zijinensis TaxID=2320716 RepID=A0AAP0B1J2_9ASPA
MEAGGGVDVPAAGCPAAIALDFSSEKSSSSTPAKVPRRIRRRLLDCKHRSSLPSSVEVIEAKLKEADLRRQKFHEWLSSKARTKPRSPSWSSQEGDPGQRLEEKLNAAEQKRLSLLANAQMRLARLDELRHAAKCGVQMRFEKQREELGSRVESRVQQAEENRMQLLKAHLQRHAAVQERKSRSLLQRTVQEKKYKEHIRSSISLKRSAAERKRMMLLEAQKSRAHARVMLARNVAKAVCFQRESERRKMKEQLECRLQRAKRQRAEHLRLKSNTHNDAGHVDWIKHEDLLSRKCWRRFVRYRRTTFTLVQEYVALGVNENTVKTMPFDHFASLIESATTLQTVKALLDRFESRLSLYQSSGSDSPENIDHLLKNLSSPKKRASPANKSRTVPNKVPAKISRSGASKHTRYPVRAVLCAYMILGHPKAVFSEQGEHEVALSSAALEFIQEFELLINYILDGASRAPKSKLRSLDVLFVDSMNREPFSMESSPEKSFRDRLSTFDAVWRSYLHFFVVWKGKDARLLEDDLVRAACQLELSMMQTCKLTSEGKTQTLNLSHDMMAIQEQVTEDQKLLREKVEHLSGNEGLQRMEHALSETRSKFFESKESGAPFSSPIIASSSVKLVVPASEEHCIDNREGTSHVARSLFGHTSVPSSQSSCTSAGKLSSENELLVNEIVHGGHCNYANHLDVENTYGIKIKAKVKETMEKAFWDGVMESVQEDSADYGRILALVKEVRHELSEMAPVSWKQDIRDSIDIDILSQVMELGTRDRDYLGRILEYALLTLRKLSAAAKEDDLKNSHEKLLNELASIAQSDGDKKSSFTLSIIKGLRFVLEQIQTLKKEISEARIQLFEPIIKGTAGLEYLQKAFEDRYGSPSSAADTLTLTKQWLSPLKDIAEDEWSEYVDSLSLLPESHGLPPVTSLRTGGSMPWIYREQPHPVEEPANGQPECTGEKLDVLLRLGLLRLANSIEGLITDTVPETMKLNVLRLRSLQSQVQQIIVISTSILVLRQIIISQGLSLSSLELDAIISNSVKSLSELLNSSPDVGIEEIIEVISRSFPDEKLQSKKPVMERVLAKSLEDDDAVFRKVNHSIYLATRALLFGGTGPRGQSLAFGILQKVGAAMLLDKVVSAAEALIVVADVSRRVHGQWYGFLV